MNKGIKILMIVLQHSAKDDRIFYKEAISLKNNGYQVSYLLLTDKSGYIRDMSGKILNSNKENVICIDGIKIIGFRPPTDMLNSLLKKVFLGSFQHDFVNAVLKENADIYHAHEPISLRFAFKASKISKKKVIFDSHETWINGTAKEQLIKRFYLKRIKYLITVNPAILKMLSKNLGIIYSEVIYNTSLTSLFPFRTATKKIDLPIQLVHEGSLSFDRGLKILLNSILLLKTQFPNINLKIIGDSPKVEKNYISDFILKNNLQENINITGWINYEDVAGHLANCDIGLILYTPSKNNLSSTSNKLFNYIAAGLAIISADLPETAKVLDPLNNAYILKAYNSRELANTIQRLIENPNLILKMKNASVQAYQKYNWEIEENKLLDFYQKVIDD